MEKRLDRKIDDLNYEKEIHSLFDGADQFQVLNRLIAIEQRINNLTDLAVDYFQSHGQQVIG